MHIELNINLASLVADSKEYACNVGDPVRFLGLEDPLEEVMAPTPVLLPGKCHG